VIKVGDVIDRYIIVSPLGQGGYATVWLARHQSLESLHALKILHVSSTDHAQRLMSEGRIQASLEHPHIVSVTDAIQTESGLVLVMPYVAGSSLAVYLENHRPSLQETQGLMQGVLEG
jgi:serine/threonine protein kinase